MIKKQNRVSRVREKKARREQNYQRILKAAQTIYFEGLVIACAGSSLADGTLTNADRQRELVSVQRVRAAADVVRGAS
ncbi:MAG: hypothetical protein LBE75_02210 [Burkholderiales bacterium]|jgi:tellurite resistance protein|nr:hypothetical protein [Burkholderiales bacterium]